MLVLVGSWTPSLTAQETTPPAKEDLLKAVLDKPAMENLEELRLLEKQVRTVVEKVTPCTVGIRIGAAAGSGVIISEDGYILTAGHVSGQADRNCTILLADGRQVKAKTLGADFGADSGLIKITDEGKWPHVEMGKSGELKKGQWCIAIGHPGGYRPGRSPVVRLGRILNTRQRLVQTDCTLVSGDSGGPLFDLDGKVIGIHSHIGLLLTINMCVAVDNYRDNWDRLAKGETWGGPLAVAAAGGNNFGLRLKGRAEECIIAEVAADSPAAKAGLQVGDVVLKLDEHKIGKVEEFYALMGKKKPGDETPIEVRRGQDVLSFKLTLGKRGT
jgi:serine protease Do